jgi:NAD(P)H dehydrogenase (quinone)
VLYQAGRLDSAGFEAEAERLRARMRTLAETPPIPYRRQNGGDYLIPAMELRPELGDPNGTGFAVHLSDAAGSRV